MSELINLFKKLSEFYENSLIWEHVEKIYEQEVEAKTNKPPSPEQIEMPRTQRPRDRNGRNRRNSNAHSSSEDRSDSGNNSTDDEPLAEGLKFITSLPAIKRALKDPEALSTLLELCTTIRSLRESSASSYDNTYDCWDEVIKVSPRDPYLAFIYALAALGTLDSSSSTFTKLSLAAVSTYFLSLTIPGAKGFHIFEEAVIAHCLQSFTLLERIRDPGMKQQQSVDIWVRFSALFDDLKLLLRYVHFNDQKATRDLLMRKLIEIQYLNHDKGYANMYASNLHAKCFELYEELINAHNGEPEETLMKLMNMTVILHTYSPKPRNSSAVASGDCEHISDWFIKCMVKYPRLIANLLKFYIECIITNPIKTWKTEQTQRALEYAAKYDAALFTQCNESSVDFLCEAIYADEVVIRSRTVDLISRILQLESHVNWPMFRHEVSDIPREVYLLKELIDSLKDSNANIKLKAVQALQVALTKGSQNSQKIMSEGIRFAKFNDENVKLPEEPRVGKNEIRYEKPTELEANYTFAGHGIIELSFLQLPEFVYKNLFRSPISYIRRAGIMFMEYLVKANSLIVFDTNFVQETVCLTDEPTALVRKQTLLTVDGLLATYPNCYPIVWVWCKIIAPMFKDADPKNIELAMNCFHSRVLLNMKGIDQSNKAEHFMPWVIIRIMLSTQSRLYLQTCFHLALQKQLIKTNILSIIESHLLTSNSTEAWIVLNFISGKVKSKEPDSLIHMFINMESWNKEQNMLIALEVLASCINDFSHTSLNYAFTHILNEIREGKMMPVLIGKAFDFLINIDNKSHAHSSKTAHAAPLNDKPWVLDLHRLLEERILGGINDFPDNRSTMMSFLYSYSEVNLHIRMRPHRTIISFVHKYMSVCMRLPESELDSENHRIFNSMILIAGRLSLRDAAVASATCNLYGAILRAIDRPPIVNTVVVAVTDLCKKHTQIVEHIMDLMLRKLFSTIVVNRIETFKCFERLVLQDHLKLRGSLLLAMLAAMLDESENVSQRACRFFAEFLSKKNPALFQKCLIECPFVLNEYKNFDGLDSFSESTIRSPLKGESKRKSRRILYNHLMTSVDDISLVLYFGQLKLLAEKSANDDAMKTPEGVDLVKDVLFILRRVCQQVKEQKASAGENHGDGENPDVDLEADILGIAGTEDQPPTRGQGAVPTGATGNVKGKAATANPIGRGRRRRVEATMTDALNLLEKSLIFIPTIHQNLITFDSTLQKSFDGLGRALFMRFPHLIEYAQPANFWSKYCQAKTTRDKNPSKKSKSSSKKRAKANDDESETDDVSLSSEVEDEGEDDNDTDVDKPSTSHRSVARLHKGAPKRFKGQDAHSKKSSSTRRTGSDDKEDKENAQRMEISSNESDFDDSDDDLPLMNVRTNSSPSSKRSRPSCSELPVEYLFNPNI